MQQIKKSGLKKLIARGEINEVIDSLLTYFEENKKTTGITSFEKEVIISSYRYNENERNYNSGVLKEELYFETKNKIIVALINLLDKIFPDTLISQNESSTEDHIDEQIDQEVDQEIAEEEIKARNTEILISLLEDQDLDMMSFMNEEDADEILDTLAFYVGQHHDKTKVRELIDKIRKANKEQHIIIELKNTLDQIDPVTNIANRLDNYLFALKNYNTNRKKLTITPYAGAKSFFSEWEHRYLVKSVKEIIKNKFIDIDFKYIRRPHFKIKDTQYALDLIFMLDGQKYILKANSQIITNPESIRNLIDFFKIDKNNAFVLLANTKKDKLNAIKVLHKINAYNIQSFYESLDNILSENHSDKLKINGDDII